MSIEWLLLRNGIVQTQKSVASELIWLFTARLVLPRLCTWQGT